MEVGDEGINSECQAAWPSWRLFASRRAKEVVLGRSWMFSVHWYDMCRKRRTKPVTSLPNSFFWARERSAHATQRQGGEKEQAPQKQTWTFLFHGDKTYMAATGHVTGTMSRWREENEDEHRKESWQRVMSCPGRSPCIAQLRLRLRLSFSLLHASATCDCHYRAAWDGATGSSTIVILRTTPGDCEWRTAASTRCLLRRMLSM